MTLKSTNSYYYSSQQQGIDRRIKSLLIRRCEGFMKGPRVLDLGYVDGDWTDAALAAGAQVDVVEGADAHVAVAREKYKANANVRVFHSMFEAFKPDVKYTTIIAGDMLRYLDDPVAYLSLWRSWLAEGGVLIATLPNSRSMHRRIGTLMGMEGHPTQLNQTDKHVGNLTSYDRYELRDLLQRSGWRIRELRGCFLKPLSSKQMEDWSDEMLGAFLEMGDELEDYAWFLYAICE